MILFDFFIRPFLEYDFMARALFASWAVAVAGAPIGVFMMFRRLALMGDALSHAILPGAAIGYLFAGLYFPALFLGGLFAGLVVAGLASWLAEATAQREDNSLATLYLLSLASGVLLVSQSGSSIDLLHLLFGSVLSLDDVTFRLVIGGALLALTLLFLFGRALLFEALDPNSLRRAGFPVRRIHFLFLFLVVLTLVIGFQAMGTLMALGMILIPAAASRLIARSLSAQILWSMLIGILSSFTGLLLSFHADWPSGPAIVMSCGFFFVIALLIGPTHGMWRKLFPQRHRLIRPLLIFALATPILSSRPSRATPPQLRVVTTFSIPASWVQEIGGDSVEVHSLIPVGQDPHGFQPRARDLESVKKADLYVSIGWGFDNWSKALYQSSGSKAASLVLTQGIKPLAGAESETPGHTHASEDPHFWHDPSRTQIALRHLRDQLTQLRPQEKDMFEQRELKLSQELTRIAEETRKALAPIPSSKRVALSPHQSFRYLGEAFNLQFISPQGLSTDQELRAKRLADVETRLRRGEIQVAFSEEGHPSVAFRNLTQKYKIPTSSLYSDTLGAPGSRAATYKEMLEHNLHNMTQAFLRAQSTKEDHAH